MPSQRPNRSHFSSCYKTTAPHVQGASSCCNSQLCPSWWKGEMVMCPCIGYRSLAFIFIWALIPIYWVYLVRQPLIPLKVQAQGKKKDIEAGVTLSSSISVSLEVVVSHTKCVGWAPQRSEGCPRYHSHSCLLLTHVLWNTDCDDSKDGHRALWFSLSSQPPTQISHPFHKASACSASVLMGEKKSWVLQMCRAQTTTKQVTDERNSPAVFTVKDGTNVVPSWGNQPASQPAILLQNWLTKNKWHHVRSRTFAYKPI